MRGLQATVQRCSMTPSLSWSSTCLSSSIDEGEIDRKVETAAVLGSNHGSLNAPAFRVYGCGHHASWTPGWRKVSTQQTRTSQHELRRRPPRRLLKMRQSCQVELYPLQPTPMWRYLIWRVNYRRGIDYWERDVCRSGIEGSSACSRDQISTIPLTRIAKKKRFISSWIFEHSTYV